MSILTYISQFCQKLAFSKPDSGISSLSESPASSDSEVESFGVSSSSAERRGAILSLMDGRRVRSVSCHARRRGRSEGRSPASPPIEKENPFIRELHNSSSVDYINTEKMKQVNKYSLKSLSTERSVKLKFQVI